MVWVCGFKVVESDRTWPALCYTIGSYTAGRFGEFGGTYLLHVFINDKQSQTHFNVYSYSKAIFSCTRIIRILPSEIKYVL